MLAPWFPMPARPTPESLRAEAEQLEKRAKGLRLQAEALEARDAFHATVAAIAEKAGESSAAILRELQRGQHGHQSVTPIGDMNQLESDSKKRPGRKLRSRGPVARVARETGLSMAEIARRVGAKYDAVKKWDKRGVPEEHVEALRLVAAEARKPE